MPWLNEPAGTVTQWAVACVYGDGEIRYHDDYYTDETEARQEAEVRSLELLRREEAPSGETSVVAYRAVSRQVTYGPWS